MLGVGVRIERLLGFAAASYARQIERRLSLCALTSGFQPSIPSEFVSSQRNITGYALMFDSTNGASYY